MADSIKVLRYGETIEDAPTRAMLSDPQEDYTKSLWAVRSIEKQAAPSDDIALEVRGVDASYGNSVKVLRDVNIKVPRGRTVAVVGESGSGKSTTARAITGLLPPSKGEILFNGKALPAALKNRSKEQLQRIQMIYQMADTAMNPRAYGARYNRPPFAVLFGLIRCGTRSKSIAAVRAYRTRCLLYGSLTRRIVRWAEAAYLYRPEPWQQNPN